MTRTDDQPGGADLARTALRAARRTARLNGTAPVKKTPPTRRQIARAPSTIAVVMPAMASAQGWALGTAQGTMRSNWAQLVGAEESLHWFPAGFNPDTRTLRITCDSPAWATKLRLEQRAILAKLNTARPDTVRAIDIRVGATAPSAPATDIEPTTGSAQQHTAPAPAPEPAAPPLADSPAYQQLRQQMRDQAVARRTALDAEAAAREEILRRHYNRLREPESAHRPCVEDEEALARAARARELLARHHAALAVARGHAVPLRTARQPQPAPARGAA
ncbi:DUF721 domain-containing protein [Kitasatospora sp. NPDC004669]|uniref:DUF721 domain-containing protein n=1 Tax=Kitasatospora sp. NPDC004669 TaxID=3154555 RepID=UPI0033BF0906